MAERRDKTHFLDVEVGAALTLVVGLTGAIAWSALSPAGYSHAIHVSTTTFGLSSVGLGSLHGAVLNGLMTIFFYAIGLELTREMRHGTLSNPRHAVAPVTAALGGMIATALLSIGAGALLGSSILRRGWGVPMATDVAFTLGVIALAGRRLPPTLRLFVLTLAIADDVFSVVALALSGSASLHVAWLVGTALAVALAVVALRVRPNVDAAIVVLVVMWYLFTRSGVEPSLAGVLAGALTPTTMPGHDHLELVAARISTWIVLPFFALVACGVDWPLVRWDSQSRTVIFATVAIRVIGKVGGICGGVALARLAGFRVPSSLGPGLIAATALTCAIGFTVPLLFAGRVFGSTSPVYASYTLGLLASSIIAAVLGVPLLRSLGRRQ